jgi:hypothetical protein
MVLATPRRALLQRGLRLEVFTVGWNVIEAIVAIAAGASASSVALIGFGLDSVIESISGVALYRRLRGELLETEADHQQDRERRALLFVGVSFFLIAAYVAYEAGATLRSREAPERTLVGIRTRRSLVDRHADAGLAQSARGERAAKPGAGRRRERDLRLLLSFRRPPARPRVERLARLVVGGPAGRSGHASAHRSRGMGSPRAREVRRDRGTGALNA